MAILIWFAGWTVALGGLALLVEHLVPWWGAILLAAIGGLIVGMAQALRRKS